MTNSEADQERKAMTPAQVAFVQVMKLTEKWRKWASDHSQGIDEYNSAPAAKRVCADELEPLLALLPAYVAEQRDAALEQAAEETMTRQEDWERWDDPSPKELATAIRALKGKP
jgi:hypothetical protein